MAMTAYCRKCRRDVPMGEECPYCGGRLTRSSARVAWCVEHRPVRDWMCWNAVARIALPSFGTVLVLILALEGLAGGAQAVVQLMQGGLLTTLALLLALSGLLLLLILTLQGKDLCDCVVDSRGVHVQQYLVNPTPVKLLVRFRDPRSMAQADQSVTPPVLLIGSRELCWKDIARVQLWPEKTCVLLYAPAWWMRLALPCTPFTYPDVLDYMRDKVGRKKNLLLPRELVAPPKPRAPKAKPAEQPEDFVPLADVLEEIKSRDDAP